MLVLGADAKGLCGDSRAHIEERSCVRGFRRLPSRAMGPCATGKPPIFAELGLAITCFTAALSQARESSRVRLNPVHHSLYEPNTIGLEGAPIIINLKGVNANELHGGVRVVYKFSCSLQQVDAVLLGVFHHPRGSRMGARDSGVPHGCP